MLLMVTNKVANVTQNAAKVIVKVANVTHVEKRSSKCYSEM